MDELITNEEIEKIRKYYNEGEGVSDGNAEDIRVLVKKIDSLKEENAKLKEQVENWKDAVNDYSFAVKNLEEKNANLKEDMKEKNQIISQRDLRIKVMEEEVESLKEELIMQDKRHLEMCEENANIKKAHHDLTVEYERRKGLD